MAADMLFSDLNFLRESERRSPKEHKIHSKIQGNLSNGLREEEFIKLHYVSYIWKISLANSGHALRPIKIS